MKKRNNGILTQFHKIKRIVIVNFYHLFNCISSITLHKPHENTWEKYPQYVWKSHSCLAQNIFSISNYHTILSRGNKYVLTESIINFIHLKLAEEQKDKHQLQCYHTYPNIICYYINNSSWSKCTAGHWRVNISSIKQHNLLILLLT